MKKERKDLIKKIIAYVEENPNDKEYIKSYAVRYPKILEYVDYNVFGDIDFYKSLLSINGMLLEYMPEKIKNNKELVIIAVKNSSGFALCFANKKLRADIEVVKYAILKYKYPLIYASEELQMYFMKKWDKYYLNHKERNFGEYSMSYNGIRTSKEEMDKIYEKDLNTKRKKMNVEEIPKNEEYEAIKDFLEEQQIKFNEYYFEEKDEN